MMAAVRWCRVGRCKTILASERWFASSWRLLPLWRGCASLPSFVLQKPFQSSESSFFWVQPSALDAVSIPFGGSYLINRTQVWVGPIKCFSRLADTRWVIRLIAVGREMGLRASDPGQSTNKYQQLQNHKINARYTMQACNFA